jgi:hypothetical protein
VSVYCNGWPKGTVAQAEHFFYNNGFAFALCLSAFPHLTATAGLASLSTANMNNWACWRGRSEVFVEGDHTVHFGNRNVEGVGKDIDEITVDVSGSMLQSVQCGQQATGGGAKTAHDCFQL